MRCPICKSESIGADLVCAQCGSLEGVIDAVSGEPRQSVFGQKSKSSMFAFDWSAGYVSPFLPAKDGVLASALDEVQRMLDEKLPRESESHFRSIAGGGNESSHSQRERPFTVMDLGCGDGRILVEAATRWGRRIRAIGVELDETLVAEARKRAEAADVSDHVTISAGDIFAASSLETAARADVVFLYHLPAALQKLSRALAHVLRNGTTVVSFQWEVPGWRDHETRHAAGFYAYTAASSTQ